MDSLVAYSLSPSNAPLQVHPYKGMLFSLITRDIIALGVKTKKERERVKKKGQKKQNFIYSVCIHLAFQGLNICTYIKGTQRREESMTEQSSAQRY